MTVFLSASAPGKLMLFGEYAVLEGAPALLSAVDRRVTVRLERGGEGRFEYRLLGAEESKWDDGSKSAHESLGPFVGCAIEALGLELADLTGIRLVADTRELVDRADGGVKLGLGSSAASMVALVGVLGEASDRAAALRGKYGDDWVWQRADAAHLRFQNGKGSGADVATSYFGGTIEFLREGPSATRLTEESVPWGAVWTGEAADTRYFLTQLEKLESKSPARYGQWMGLMADVARAACPALERGQIGEVLDCVRSADALMDELTELLAAPVVTEAHLRLRAHARGAGVAVKTSGAGGGDLSLVFGADPENVRRFVESVRDIGLVPTTLRSAPAGLEFVRG